MTCKSVNSNYCAKLITLYKDGQCNSSRMVATCIKQIFILYTSSVQWYNFAIGTISPAKKKLHSRHYQVLKFTLDDIYASSIHPSSIKNSVWIGEAISRGQQLHIFSMASDSAHSICREMVVQFRQASFQQIRFSKPKFLPMTCHKET